MPPVRIGQVASPVGYHKKAWKRVPVAGFLVFFLFRDSRKPKMALTENRQKLG